MGEETHKERARYSGCRRQTDREWQKRRPTPQWEYDSEHERERAQLNRKTEQTPVPRQIMCQFSQKTRCQTPDTEGLCGRGLRIGVGDDVVGVVAEKVSRRKEGRAARRGSREKICSLNTHSSIASIAVDIRSSFTYRTAGGKAGTRTKLPLPAMSLSPPMLSLHSANIEPPSQIHFPKPYIAS